MIPRKVLRMSATYSPYTGENQFGQPTHGTAVTLGSVAIEGTRNTYIDATGERKQADLMLFFCATNSTPSGQEFQENGKLVFNDVDYLVRAIRPVYDLRTGALHHTEVTLAGS